MVSDQECLPTVEEKLFQAEGKKEEKKFQPKKFVTLKKRNEFLFIRNNGRNTRSKFFIINFHFTRNPETKVGLTVSKKIGNSVKRNYVKRILRSILMDKENKLPKGCDFEVIPMKHIENSQYLDLKFDLINLLKKIEI
jgi:ribonuclease P protein component